MAPSGASDTPLDVKMLRALIEKNGPPLSPMLIFTLLDALDDARGARDYWRNRNIDLKRQEATNAALLAGAYEVSRKALDRAEAAEARIAAARSIPAYSCSPNLIEPGTPVVLLRDLDRALTEGTGQ